MFVWHFWSHTGTFLYITSDYLMSWNFWCSFEDKKNKLKKHPLKTEVKIKYKLADFPGNVCLLQQYIWFKFKVVFLFHLISQGEARAQMDLQVVFNKSRPMPALCFVFLLFMSFL